MKISNKNRFFEIYENVNKISINETHIYSDKILSENRISFPIGTRVKVTSGSGLYSNKTGIVVSPREVKTDGSGIPVNIEGVYKPIDWNNKVAVKLDDGSLITMFKNRLIKIDDVDEEYDNVNEQIKIKKKIKIIKDFVKYVSDYINLGNNLPKIKLLNLENEAKKRRSFGSFDLNNDEISVVIKNRNLADVLRTLAHEMVHYKQKIDGNLKLNSGETGSEQENEANYLAGIILRNYGKINPDIFE